MIRFKASSGFKVLYTQVNANSLPTCPTKTESTWRKSVVYVEGALCASISLLENGRDLMTTTQ